MIAERAESPIHECPEQYWKDFLVGMLAHTVELCQWLSLQATGRCKTHYPKSLHRRLTNAAVAWRWVFARPDCQVSLDEACADLGLCPDMVRKRILDACKPPPDINQVVAKILLHCGERHAKPERKAADSGGVGATDWARLRDFRSLYPSGSSIEDFRRVALGVAEDEHASGR